MDIKLFLKQKIKFINFFYKEAIKPFETIQYLIESGKEPFANPPYSEDGEPPFLIEWLDADECIDVLGHTAISMLSESLKLFLKYWVERLESQTGYTYDKKKIFENGWFPAYLWIINDIGFSLGNIKVDVLEQIALARNRIQHPETLTTNRIFHSEKDLTKYPNPYFSEKSNLDSFCSPSLKVTGNKVETAIHTVEEFCSYLDDEFSRNSELLRKKYKKNSK